MTLAIYIFLAGLVAVIVHAGRRNKLYYLFIPMVLVYKACIFITLEFEAFGMNLYQEVVVASIIMVSLIINDDHNYQNIFRIKSFENRMLQAFVLYVIAVVLITVMSGESLFKALTLSRFILYIPLLYDAYLRIFQGVTAVEFDRFIDKVIKINALFAVLYILDSSGLMPIYSGEKYYTEITLYGAITRNYATFPPLTIISIIFLLKKIKEKITVTYVAILLIHIICAFFTYTRSLMISLAVVVSLFLLLNMVSSAQKKKLLLSFSILLAVVFTAYSLMADYNAGPLLFFTERFQLSSTTLLADNNLAVRLAVVSIAYEIAGTMNNVWTGAGFFQSARNIMESYWSSWQGDTMWSTFLLHTGILGSIGFLAWILSILYKLLIKIKEQSTFAVDVFLVICYYLIMSFTSEGFMSYFYLPVMFIALAEVEIQNIWMGSPQRVMAEIS